MNRVIDFKKCQQCGGVICVHSTSLWGACSEEDICKYCGYTKTIEIRDEDLVVKEKKGLGYVEFLIGTTVQTMALEDVAQKEDVNEWVMRCKNNPQIDWSVSYITKWNEEKERVELIYGREPESYESLLVRISDLPATESTVISYGLLKSQQPIEDDDIPF